MQGLWRVSHPRSEIQMRQLLWFWLLWEMLYCICNWEKRAQDYILNISQAIPYIHQVLTDSRPLFWQRQPRSGIPLRPEPWQAQTWQINRQKIAWQTTSRCQAPRQETQECFFTTSNCDAADLRWEWWWRCFGPGGRTGEWRWGVSKVNY